MKYKGAIFDLDGTILDSMYVWKKVDDDFFIGEGMVKPNNYMEEISAMCDYDIAIYTINKYHVNYSPEKLVEKWHDMARKEYVNNVLSKPYVKEYLDKLKKENIKLGIATALDEELFIPCLKRNGLYEYFDDLKNLKELNTSKNDPDIYLKVANNLGVKPNECMVFEDILVACKASKNAGFYTIGVYDNNNEGIKEYCDKFIYSFEEML